MHCTTLSDLHRRIRQQRPKRAHRGQSGRHQDWSLCGQLHWATACHRHWRQNQKSYSQQLQRCWSSLRWLRDYCWDDLVQENCSASERLCWIVHRGQKWSHNIVPCAGEGYITLFSFRSIDFAWDLLFRIQNYFQSGHCCTMLLLH